MLTIADRIIDMDSTNIHKLSFFIGLSFLTLSIYQAIVLNYPHFYTSFAFGSWLVLDFIDYRLNGNSILGYFYNHKHRYAFALFIVISSFFCFVVDYLWGIYVTQMWEWIHYKPIHFVRMYLVMNASFILGMYELFRVIRTLYKNNLQFDETPIWGFKIHNKHRGKFYLYCLLIGILGLIIPGYVFILDTKIFIEYVMLFPFISMILISDGITFLTGGQPILDRILHLKKLDTVSLVTTSLIASIITEGLNLFGNEWRYIRMPLSQLTVLDIPVAVFIGWIPLVIGSIALVNMIKHVGYSLQKSY